MNSPNKSNSLGLSCLIIATMIVALQFVQIPGLWTFTILIPGLITLFVSISKDSVSVSSLSFGTVATTTGLILLGQSITGRWEAWSYIWAIYPISLGLIMIYVGNRNVESNLKSAGQRLLTLGIVLLATFGIFFEAFIFQNGGLDYLNLMIASALAIIGVYFLSPTAKSRNIVSKFR